VVAQAEANKAVIEPSISVPCCIVGLDRIKGETRIRRNTPATTMVDLWSRAETGVGPSMAAGSHGCRPN